MLARNFEFRRNVYSSTKPRLLWKQITTRDFFFRSRIFRNEEAVTIAMLKKKVDGDTSGDDSSSEYNSEDESSTETEDVDEDTLQRESGKKSHKPMKNPFHFANKRTKKDESDSEDDDDSDSDDSEEDDVDDVKKGDGAAGEDEEEEEDSLIRALKAAKQPRDRTCPPDIRLSKRDLTDLAFHPEKNLIATALIDGNEQLFRCFCVEM